MRGQKTLDTLYANESKSVALFFPSPIRQAVTGHEGFVFSYDREEAGHVGLLQGVEGKESNLLLITMDGNVYAYILKYAKELSQLNYFVREGKQIGREWPVKEVDASSDSLVMDVSLYERVSKLLLEREPKVMATQRKRGIRLRLEDMVYDGREVYLVLGIRNRSGIDFEVDRLEVLRVNGSKKRRTSYQETQIEIIERYNKPKMVKNGEAKRFVFVLPKFVLADREHLKLVLVEHHGSRVVRLTK